MEKFKIEYYVPHFVYVMAETEEGAIDKVLDKLPHSAEDVKVVNGEKESV